MSSSERESGAQSSVAYRPVEDDKSESDSETGHSLGLFIAVLAFVAACLTVSVVYANNSKTHDELAHRLPTNIAPAAYRVSIEPNFLEFTFNGTASIDVEVSSPTRSIVLHAADCLHVHDITLRGLTLAGRQQQWQPTKVSRDNVMQYLVLDFATQLVSGEVYTLDMAFESALGEELYGFYRSSYRNTDDELVWVGVTQFASSHAREAFPCFDEPAMKSRFSLTLVGVEGQTVLANMPEVRRQPIPGKVLYDNQQRERQAVEYIFEESVLMSPYLVAWVFCDFEAYQPDPLPGTDVTIKVWTPPGETHLGQHAGDVAAGMLAHFNRRFQHEYPLDKIDMCAIPAFAFGAMENYGLITYRTTALLFDPENPQQYASTSRNGIRHTVAHELVHQWVGNLVTMSWWDDVWLNEGFATDFNYYGVHEVLPEWHESVRQLEHMETALEYDAQPSATPVRLDFQEPPFDDSYSTSAYQKGAAVVSTIRGRVDLTKDSFDNETTPFWQAVAVYFQKHQYATATSESFLAVVDDFTEVDALDAFLPWLEQPGFPVVHVQESSSASITLSQERFFAVDAGSAEDLSYPVPFNYRFTVSPLLFMRRVTSASDDVHFIDDFHHSQYPTSLDVPANTCLLANVERTAYYRVSYSPSLAACLSTLLADDRHALSARERVGLLSDSAAMTLSTSRQFTAQHSLAFLDYTIFLPEETEWMVWRTALSGIDRLSLWLVDEQHTALLDYAACLMSDVHEWVGWREPVQEEEEHDRNLLRVNVLSSAVQLAIPGAATQASEQFQRLVDDAVVPALDLIDPVYRGAVHADNGAAAVGHALWLLDRLSDTVLHSTEEQRIVRSLAASSIVEDLAREAIGDDAHPLAPYTIQLLTRAHTQQLVNATLAWNIVVQEWNSLCGRYCDEDETRSSIEDIITGVTTRFHTQDMHDEVEEFFQGISVFPHTKHAVDQVLQGMSHRIWWHETHAQAMNQHLVELLPLVC